MGFMPCATRFERIAPVHASDPYSSAPATGKDRVHIVAFNAALSSSSSTVTPNQAGSETTSVAVLTIPDTSLDIRVGDMVRTVPDDGRRWRVRGFPSKDVNPFTGWQPTIEATLEEVRGV